MAKGRRSANRAGWRRQLTTKTAVAKLSDVLNTIEKKYARSPEQQRRRVLLALAAGSDFISAMAPEVGPKYLSFHMLLVAAMNDLDKGAVVPMLKPKNIGKGRRVTFSKSQISWHAAATMKSLMGLRLTRPQASKLVANLLCDHGLGNITARSIADCYDNQKQTWHGLFVAGTERTVRFGRQQGWAPTKIQRRLLEILADTADHWYLSEQPWGKEDSV
jgi:hypothetical protein